MEEPKILHDHIIGWSSEMRTMFLDVETGKLNPDDALRFFVTPDGQVLQSLHTMWMMLLGYRHYGQQTFVVGPQLQGMLENTSLVGVPWDAIKWPYPFFYLALPDCLHTISGGPTGLHQVTGIVVGFNEPGDRMLVYIWGAENENSRVVGDDASFWFTLPIKNIQAAGQDMESYIDELMRDPDGTWTDGSNAPITPPTQDSLSRAEIVRHGAADENAISVAKAMLRIVINLCVYLQSMGTEKSSHPKFEAQRKEKARLQGELSRKKNPKKKSARHLLKELEKLSDAQVTWLGRTIEETTRSGGGGHGEFVRHWVRGHWYPRLDNAEARARQGIRWVQPYERNKDLGHTQSSRHYQVKEVPDEKPCGKALREVGGASPVPDPSRHNPSRETP